MMVPVTERLPLSISEVFPMLGLSAEPIDGATVLRITQPTGVILEDFVPVTQSLEWRLAEHQWATRGLLPFVDGEVPFWINNTGRLSQDAAVLLFAFCESGKVEGPIRAVELGAGTGLFARYVLEDFRTICQQEGRDYYDRFDYLVTDASETTVNQWAERRLFSGHEDHVATMAARAEDVVLQGVHAVFANYVLDVLPATILDSTQASVWRELQVRTRWAGDTGMLEKLMGRTAQEAQRLACDTSKLPEFEPLLGRLDLEVRMEPFTPSTAERRLLSLAEPGRQSFNFGAAWVIERCLTGINPPGFLLINDYGATKKEDAGDLAFSQRFGRTSAIGLNFPLLTAFAESLGGQTLAANEDDKLPIHARLIGRHLPNALREQFLARFSNECRIRQDSLLNDARRHSAAGRYDEALQSYTKALELAPRDWSLLGEAADFVGLRLNDPAAGLELARGAVQRNPWYSAWLWNVLGDCLYGLRRFEEAHEAYRQAERIDPRDPRTNLNLSFPLLQSSKYEDALAKLARGLASDEAGMFRSRLLAKQEEVLKAISAEAAREMESQQRRAERLRAP